MAAELGASVALSDLEKKYDRVTAVAGVVHYWWLVKADIRHPAIYAALVTLLLGFRLVLSVKKWRVQHHPVQARA